MKKISILLTCLAFSAGFAQSFVTQATTTPTVNSNLGSNEILLEQVAFGASGIISDTNSADQIVASADDIDLTYDATKITKLSAFGFCNTADLIANTSGVSFYIIADEDWYPTGSNPVETNLYAVELNHGDAGLTVIDNGDTTYQFDFDLNAAGENIILPAGKYWISVVANTTLGDILAGDSRWNWYQNISANGVGSYLTDPEDLFGLGVTSWSEIAPLTGWTESDLSMIVEGEESMGLNDLQAATIAVYPNPATNFVKASVKNGEVKEMIVTNMSGQVVASSKTASVNVSTLPAGIYVVKVMDTKGNVTTSKVVKK